MIVGDIASKDCGSCCSRDCFFIINLAYDHNFLGLQTGLDKVGKELDKTGKAISKE